MTGSLDVCLLLLLTLFKDAVSTAKDIQGRMSKCSVTGNIWKKGGMAYLKVLLFQYSGAGRAQSV
jgi:hypothetical protein